MLKKIGFILLLMGWLIISIQADFFRDKYRFSQDLLNFYPRQRWLIGLGGSYSLTNMTSSGTLETDAFMAGQGAITEPNLDKTYKEGDKNGIGFQIWSDYWLNRHWGIIAKLGYQQWQSEGAGEIQLYRYYYEDSPPNDTTYWVYRHLTASNDAWKYDLGQIQLAIAPKYTFKNFYIFAGANISVNLVSKWELQSTLIDTVAYYYGYPIPVNYYWDVSEMKSRSKSEKVDIPNLNAFSVGAIAGLGLYLPITAKIWLVPECSLEKMITSPFPISPQKFLELRSTPDDREKGHLRKMGNPDSQWLRLGFQITLVYRY